MNARIGGIAAGLVALAALAAISGPVGCNDLRKALWSNVFSVDGVDMNLPAAD